MKSLRVASLVLGISTLSGGCSVAGPGTGSPSAPPAAAHHDHTSELGGTVLMNGDVHFEIVPDLGGRHAVLFSDAHRRAIPASAIQEATLEVMREGESAEVLALRPNGAGVWIAAGRRIGTAEVTLRFSYRQQGDAEPYSIDLTVAVSRASHAGHRPG